MAKQCILVVEDHEPLLLAIQDVLEEEGYAVLTATDGVKALAVMEASLPDLIVADIMMPQMDGYAFYKAVRARKEWISIPFIFLTAKAEREDILRGKELGVEDYLTKPFEPRELVVAVRAKLSRAQAIREVTEAQFDQLKQQIVTVLGHELRTPLTYVRGYTDLALEDLPALSSEQLEEFLQGIRKGADRLTRLVEDLLLLIRLDTGQAAEEAKMLTRMCDNLGEIVLRVVGRYEGLASAQGVSLKAQVAPDLPPVQLCEPFLADALGRLVDNGIKFCRGNNKQVTVRARVADGGVEVAVEDNGVGIPAEEMGHLFERFRQIGRDRMEQQGAGLGLAIARELVRLQGGDITASSRLGVGSTFTIRLPVVADE